MAYYGKTMCCSCRKQCVDGQQRHWCELVRLDGNEKEKVIQILDTPLTLEMTSLLRMLCCLSLCKCQWDFLSTITWMRSNAILACKNIYWEGSFSTRFGVNSVRSKSLKKPTKPTKRPEHHDKQEHRTSWRTRTNKRNNKRPSLRNTSYLPFPTKYFILASYKFWSHM